MNRSGDRESNSSITGKKILDKLKNVEIVCFCEDRSEKSPAKEEVTMMKFHNSEVSVEYLQQFDRKLFTRDVRNRPVSVVTIFVALFPRLLHNSFA